LRLPPRSATPPRGRRRRGSSPRGRRRAPPGRAPLVRRARSAAPRHCKIGWSGHPCARRLRDRSRGADDGPMPGSDKTTTSAANKAAHYHGHRRRLRHSRAGSEAISDYEMLELILFRAIPQRDVKPLAKDLLATFGSFSEVIAAPVERLNEVDGLGEAAIAELKIVQAAANRLVRGEVKQRQVLSSWSNVLDYCRAAMAFE